MSIRQWARGVYWWWWFRFAGTLAGIVIYNVTYRPHGFVATWLISLAVGAGTSFALDGCRAAYRREKARERTR